jgi:pimeloyl-ACP methyl ester carboxylesterase
LQTHAELATPNTSGVPAHELSVLTDDGVLLRGEQAGEGVPIVLLHGLTATRRYVVMGSRLLERSGHRVIAYDARGHGRSAPAPAPAVPAADADPIPVPGAPATDAVGGRSLAAYGYARLARDIEAVLDALELPRAALVGVSMGAHTALRFALDRPARVSALGIVTPGFDPAADAHADSPEGDRDALARGLREGGVEGFMRAYDFSTVHPGWRETVERAVKQRLSLHEHPAALADALEAVSRSRPFEDLAELRHIAAPSVVVASRDELDPGHPLALAERYAHAIPGATLVVEDEPADGLPSDRRTVNSPIAWQGGQLSKVLLGLLARVCA